jgi:hypothetical protein
VQQSAEEHTGPIDRQDSRRREIRRSAKLAMHSCTTCGYHSTHLRVLHRDRCIGKCAGVPCTVVLRRAANSTVEAVTETQRTGTERGAIHTMRTPHASQYVTCCIHRASSPLVCVGHHCVTQRRGNHQAPINQSIIIQHRAICRVLPNLLAHNVKPAL